MFCSTALPNVNNQWAGKHNSIACNAIVCIIGSNENNCVNSLVFTRVMFPRRIQNTQKKIGIVLHPSCDNQLKKNNNKTLNYNLIHQMCNYFPCLIQQLLFTANTARMQVTFAPSAVKRLCATTADRNLYPLRASARHDSTPIWTHPESQQGVENERRVLQPKRCVWWG